MHRTLQNRRCCTTIVKSYRLSTVHVSAKKASNIHGRWSFLTLIHHTHTSFKVICLCVTRKQLRAFIMRYILQKVIRHDVCEWRCIKWKITNFSGSTPVRCLLCSKPPRHTNLFCSETTVDYFLSLKFNGHVHSVTHGQLWKPQHTYIKRAIH